jgi:serine phosphatase RsbU (regulator of sigma subunit)
VGLTAAGTSDFRANPFDPVYPMVGAQASLCESMLRGVFISRAQPGVRIAVALAVIAFALLICVHAAPLPAFLCCLLLACAYAGLVWVLFGFRGLFLDLFLPALSVAVVYTAVLARKFLEEAQKRRVLENELKIAAEIQRSFLPPDVRTLSGIGVRSFLLPAKYVGGDLFDVISLDQDTVGFFIGDVAGKGISASLIMAQTISLLRVLARTSLDPAQVMTSLNRHLALCLKGRFVTGQYIVVHVKDRFLEGACAGHPALLFFSKETGSVEELIPASGPPLGLINGISYATVRHGFVGGDKALLYTDGWTETRDVRGHDFGLARLKEIVVNTAAESPDSFLASLCYLQKVFQGRAEQHDDLTCLILQF